MYGALIGLGASLASSFIGGNSAAKERQKQENLLKQQKLDNDAWWRRKSNEDYVQGANAQAVLAKSRDILLDSIRSAEGAKAVSGGTDASVAQAKQAANNAIADATSGIVVNGEARKGAAESQYLDTKANLDARQADIYGQHASDITNSTNQVMQAGMNLAANDVVSHMDDGKGLFESAFGKNGTTQAGSSNTYSEQVAPMMKDIDRMRSDLRKTPSIFNF